jgi:Cu/Ag efflux pump CusA
MTHQLPPGQCADPHRWARGLEAERDSPDSLRTLGIRTSSGDSVPLNQVADVYMSAN